VRAAEFHGLRINTSYVYSRSLDNVASSVFPLLPTSAINQGITSLLSTGDPSFFCNVLGEQGTALCPGNGTPGSRFGAISTAARSVSPLLALSTSGAGQAIVTPYAIPQDR
jgi:hypothetical protein